MKTKISHGDTWKGTVAAGSDAVDLKSGDGYLVGSLFGVVKADAKIGETVVLDLVGEFELAKTTSQAWTAGQKAYWVAATGKVSTTAGSNKQIGIVTADAGSNDSTGMVRLSGAFTI